MGFKIPCPRRRPPSPPHRGRRERRPRGVCAPQGSLEKTRLSSSCPACVPPVRRSSAVLRLLRGGADKPHPDPLPARGERDGRPARGKRGLLGQLRRSHGGGNPAGMLALCYALAATPRALRRQRRCSVVARDELPSGL